MVNKLYGLVGILFFAILVSCSDNAEEAKNSSLNAFEVWRDTVVKSKYESGDIQTVWGYKYGDTSMHYVWDYYKNGALWMEGPVSGNLRHGKWIAYNEDGVMVAQGYYKMGVATGVKTVWYSNSSKFYEGVMDNNKRVGVWQFFNKEGKLIKEINYSNNDTIIH